MVDHTFLFTPAVRKLKDLLEAGELGELLYYDSTRINLGLLQHDVDVVWDLAPHDLSILDYLVCRRTRRVAAVGSSHAPSGHAAAVSRGDASPGCWGFTFEGPDARPGAPVSVTPCGVSKETGAWDGVTLSPSSPLKRYNAARRAGKRLISGDVAMRHLCPAAAYVGNGHTGAVNWHNH